MGAVIGDQVFLKTVTRARTKPPSAPPIIQGYAASGVGEWLRPQVHAAATTTNRSSRPVLLTVPWMVIVSPPAIGAANTFSLRTGLLERNSSAIELSSSPQMGASLSRIASTRRIERRPLCNHLPKSVISTGGTALFAVPERRNLSSNSNFRISLERAIAW